MPRLGKLKLLCPTIFLSYLQGNKVKLSQLFCGLSLLDQHVLILVILLHLQVLSSLKIQLALFLELYLRSHHSCFQIDRLIRETCHFYRFGYIF